MRDISVDLVPQARVRVAVCTVLADRVAWSARGGEEAADLFGARCWVLVVACDEGIESCDEFAYTSSYNSDGKIEPEPAPEDEPSGSPWPTGHRFADRTGKYGTPRTTTVPEISVGDKM
ncbi:hypothetical protein OG285_05965 [Streptomyces sp. NBC_01471]|uniref:hypothetical protein n=1 Tax=Streptomyces sp. NBC_01471 TaxID=2903879 RepID=UPI003252608D